MKYTCVWIFVRWIESECTLAESLMANTLFLFNVSFHVCTNQKSIFSLFFSLLVNFSFSSLSLIRLYFHHYFVFLSFKHLLLNLNHRSSRMFFMVIYTNHCPALCLELQHFNQCWGWMLGCGLVWSIHVSGNCFTWKSLNTSLKVLKIAAFSQHCFLFKPHSLYWLEIMRERKTFKRK